MKNRGYDYPDVISPLDEPLPVAFFYALHYPHSTEAEWRRKIEAGQVTLNGRPATPGRRPQAGRPPRLPSPALGGARRPSGVRDALRGRGRPGPRQALRPARPSRRLLPREHPAPPGPRALRRRLLAAPPARTRHVRGHSLHPQSPGRPLAGDGHVRAPHPQDLPGLGLGDRDAGRVHGRRAHRAGPAHAPADRQRLPSRPRRPAVDEPRPRRAPAPGKERQRPRGDHPHGPAPPDPDPPRPSRGIRSSATRSIRSGGLPRADGIDDEIATTPGATGYLLHSWKIRFPHPSRGGEVEVVSPPPPALKPE
ncbi:MAG: hypothetical protein M0C28_12960 [Candidatus Moduliflexus flocculans]|nr:hypothetical protein [Candidatus Moduliflexus flocculans]